MLAIYVSLISSEGNNTLVEILPWALLMSIAAGLVLASVFVPSVRTARILLTTGAVLFALLGVVSILTIGLGFLIAAALATIGIVKLGTT